MTGLACGGTIAGVDGCKGGWIAAVLEPGGLPTVQVFAHIGELLRGLPDDAIVAVDIPIGLPDFTTHGGRGPEKLVRAFLGPRQSSVFSIPSRAAVYAAAEPFSTLDRWHAAHREASAVARATSDPPRAVSIQAFGIFQKIREVDRLLREYPDLKPRVFESHPEAAFARLNGGSHMTLPKKVRGMVNPAGIKERKALLARLGCDRAVLDRHAPRGAAEDDLLDALAMLFVAARIAREEAESFPSPPACDAFGISVAIWI